MKIRNMLAAVGTVILALGLAGCGGKDESTQEEAENKEEEYVYVAEYQTLGKDGYAVSNMVMGEDGTVYFSAVKEGETKLFAHKTDGGEEEIPIELEENTGIGALGKDTEGNLLLGLVKSGEGAESIAENVTIRKIASDGTVLQDIDTGKAMIKEDNFYMQSLLEDKEGNYYVCLANSVFVLKPDGQPYCELDAGIYISSMFSIKGEKTVIAFYGEMDYELQEADLAGKGLKALECPVSFEYGTYQDGGEAADILYTVGTKLYSYDLDAKEPEEILNWVDSDIDSQNLIDFKCLADGTVAAVSRDWNSADGTAELAVLTKTEKSQVTEKSPATEKIVLTYGTTYLPYYAKTDIVAFNKQSDKYRIEIREYGEGNKDYETTVSLWTADISSENGPDIIDMVYCPTGLAELVSMGVVEDLNPYLDADEDISREDYVENALKAYELDGKLYAIMRCFGIETMIGKISDVGEDTSWTLDDVFALMDSKGPGVELVDSTTKYNALQMMLEMNGDMFVDEESGECRFEDAEFIKILEFANRFPQEVSYDPNGPSEAEKIRNGELLLLKEAVTSVQEYQLFEYMFGEPINLIGYPTEGESGTMFSPNGTTAAMNVNSKNKEGVWEFIKFLLEKEQQENLPLGNAGFPVLRSALEKQFEKDMQTEYYEDTDGTKIERSKGAWSTGRNAEIIVEVYAATEEQVDRIRQMIETANSSSIDSQMLNIVTDEAQSYFDGQKSAEDVAALIQNRMQVYVNEKR
ncbi:MAG TPA: hypothetical protein DCZ40_10525 [Lachnospiraceae bacterium]|nr:hypothetical protein [Lachnospiraceae bacterium]